MVAPPYVNQLNLEVVVGGVVYSGNHFSKQYSTAGGQNLTFKAVTRVQSLMATRRSSVELSPISLQIVGQPFVFRVVDNGEEAPDPVDLVSDVNAPLDCGSGSLLGLLPIEAGNINVNP